MELGSPEVPCSTRETPKPWSTRETPSTGLPGWSLFANFRNTCLTVSVVSWVPVNKPPMEVGVAVTSRKGFLGDFSSKLGIFLQPTSHLGHVGCTRSTGACFRAKKWGNGYNQWLLGAHQNICSRSSRI